MTVGGFPEPFLDNNENEARRWRRERFDQILREDIRDLEPIRDIQMLSLFVEQLRRRVGGSVVLANLANDLQISPKTAKHWLEILEKMYLIFVVRPLTRDIPRAILKPPKVYFYDNGDVIGDEGARFENLVATHLLKKIQFQEDLTGYRYELRYLRDKEGREVDFALLKDGQVVELIEAKLSDKEISSSLTYYSEKLNPNRSLQIVANLKNSYNRGKLQVQSAIESLCSLDEVKIE
jgi:predicted AAA+ superfamily ATPase